MRMGERLFCCPARDGVASLPSDVLPSDRQPRRPGYIEMSRLVNMYGDYVRKGYRNIMHRDRSPGQAPLVHDPREDK